VSREDRIANPEAFSKEHLLGTKKRDHRRSPRGHIQAPENDLAVTPRATLYGYGNGLCVG